MFTFCFYVAAAANTEVFILPTDKITSSALVRQGLIPCSPITPKAAVTINCLELFRVAHLRNPHLSIQSWTKTLSDLHGVSLLISHNTTKPHINYIDGYRTIFINISLASSL